MQVAEVIAQRSSATKRKVGAVAVDHYGYILSTGYNGTPPGTDNTCEDPLTNKTYPHVIHAEANCCSRMSLDAPVGVIYTTVAPCIECAKLIRIHHPYRVVYRNEFKNDLGKSFLEYYGIKVEMLKKEE